MPTVTPAPVRVSAANCRCHPTAIALPDGHRRPTLNWAAVVEQSPLLACSLAEAALHAATAYSGARSSNAAAAAAGRLKHASSTCFAATVAVPILADAVYTVLAARAAAPTAAADTAIEAAEGGHTVADTAGGFERAAAAAQHAHGSNRLEQKLFCVLVAALKYAQVSAALQGSAAATLGSYYNAVWLLCVCSSAAIKMLGNDAHLILCNDTLPLMSSVLPVAAAAPNAQLRTDRAQQLIWLHALGRLLVAAGQLLQQVPQHVTASGSCTVVDDLFPDLKQFMRYVQVTQSLRLTLTAFGMFGVLGQGEEAATAAAGGIPAAATQADRARLLQQATSLQQQVTDIHALFKQSFDLSVQGMQAEGQLTRVQAMQKLQEACQEGGLPQQLCSFGEAYCAASPQHGCCGNPACTSLEKFTETALASQGCSGCGKVSVI